ncbi:uncharacterized protein LOC103954249 isoform X1 [Pyrus x bretschneideri]|uniref:uncharacterized protein LOC103954249 isoform X1 n=2 Tax=Pyrus x bretschneideri TaxID=225117 RepID=UPI00202F6994|nr:uncharacterized protein LOC103954249 isoform X1 [Pyrus x bretschneideri]XP_048424958.1 uncharacterized protein LOC103954249 isoform X1 [Pyrus x bretschneideri]XP_048424959.1 uncharacterized protein LOC103954249 isoform X1 [Pyrus x bretschneideri]
MEFLSDSLSGYDVYLGFTEDTMSFADALYTKFKKQNLEVFRNCIQSIKDVKELATAIQNSRTVVTVLGNNYSSSPRWLDELVNILEYHGEKKTVLPIFYNVDPSDVRNQTGSFGVAFARHQETYKDDPDKVKRWRAALTQVANLSGWVSRGRRESELIQDIVDDIWRKLHPKLPSTVPSSSILAKTSKPYCSHFSSQRWKYDVFMSFRGRDTRLNIVDNIYHSFEQKGITTFRDDKGLDRGLSISSGLVKAIEESQISLVTLSPDFASSSWCLDELVKILECTETSNLQRILEAFTEHEEASSDMVGVKCNTRDRKISKIRISVHYGGKWVNTAYIGGNATEIVVSKDITCEELLGRVYSIVGIDPNEYEIIMKTTDESELPAQPVQIADDEDLAFFIERSLCLDKRSKMNILKPRVSSSRTRRKMNELRLLVNYDGNWSNSKYIGGKTKGIMVSYSITYEELVQRLYCNLEVDASEYKIIITTAYASILPTQPVELSDDDGLRFFIDESLSLDKRSKIPLCITLQRRFYRWHRYSCSVVLVLSFLLLVFLKKFFSVIVTRDGTSFVPT